MYLFLVQEKDFSRECLILCQNNSFLFWNVFSCKQIIFCSSIQSRYQSRYCGKLFCLLQSNINQVKALLNWRNLHFENKYVQHFFLLSTPCQSPSSTPCFKNLVREDNMQITLPPFPLFFLGSFQYLAVTRFYFLKVHSRKSFSLLLLLSWKCFIGHPSTKTKCF